VISGLAALVGGLCCLTPIVLVLVGLASVAGAADLGNVLYGNYRWVFRILALALVVASLIVYFRRRGICTLDQARRERNRILNTALVVLVASVGAYIFWTYVALHYWGIAAGLPWAQYDESWAIPTAAVCLSVAVILYRVLFRRNQGGHESKGSTQGVLAGVSFLALVVAAVVLLPLRGARRGPNDSSEPWTKAQIEQPADLARELADSKNANRPIVVCVGFATFYEGAHIPGAVFHGAANSAQGLDDLKKWAQDISRSKTVVVYCGC
jgi:hypothetical protein